MGGACIKDVIQIRDEIDYLSDKYKLLVNHGH